MYGRLTCDLWSLFVFCHQDITIWLWYSSSYTVYHIYVGYICKVQGNGLRLINFQLFNHFPLNPQAMYKSFQTVHHHTSFFGGLLVGGWSLWIMWAIGSDILCRLILCPLPFQGWYWIFLKHDLLYIHILPFFLNLFVNINPQVNFFLFEIYFIAKVKYAYVEKKFLMCYNQKMFCLFWYNEKIFYMGHISHLDDLILQSIYVLLCLCTVELLLKNCWTS